MQNYQLDQIKKQWLMADVQFRAGKVGLREHGQIQLTLLQEILSAYDRLQPFYDDLKDLAEKTWQASIKAVPFVQNVDHLKDKLIVFPGTLRESFLSEDLQFRLGRITMVTHNKFLADFLGHLVANAGTLEPYFNDLTKESQKQWDQYQNNS